MHSRVAALALLGLVLLLPGAGAQTIPGFQVGPEGSYYDYKESGVTIIGPMLGVQGRWTQWVNRRFFVALDGMADAADVTYSSSFTGNTSGITDLKGDLRPLVGTDVRVERWLVLTPFTGIGYRLLYDKEGTTVTNRDFAGYNRLSQYLYLPLGMTFGIAGPGRRFEPTIEADYLVRGWQTSYLQNAGFGNNLSNVQHSGYGLRAAAMVVQPTSFGTFSLGPYLRYWKIGQSDSEPLYRSGAPAGLGFEPSNHTLETGFAFVFGLR